MNEFKQVTPQEIAAELRRQRPDRTDTATTSSEWRNGAYGQWVLSVLGMADMLSSDPNFDRDDFQTAAGFGS